MQRTGGGEVARGAGAVREGCRSPADRGVEELAGARRGHVYCIYNVSSLLPSLYNCGRACLADGGQKDDARALCGQRRHEFVGQSDRDDVGHSAAMMAPPRAVTSRPATPKFHTAFTVDCSRKRLSRSAAWNCLPHAHCSLLRCSVFTAIALLPQMQARADHIGNTNTITAT